MVVTTTETKSEIVDPARVGVDNLLPGPAVSSPAPSNKLTVRTI
jgi:hypothetical protein